MRAGAAQPASAEPTHPLLCDFVSGIAGARVRAGGGIGEMLPRAAGLGRGMRPGVVDATAGFGRDAFQLAALGSQVTLIERSPEVHAMLADGLARAREAGPPFAAAAARMTLVLGDARDLLPALRPEVVLVDPMHPPRRKSALVKQEMRVLRAVVGADDDALDLMRVALASARRRVVLKWPLRAEALAGLGPPSHSIRGKTLRFDVFMVSATKSATVD